MDTLVTGGTGFLGSAIVKNLLKQGRKVRILDKVRISNLELEILKEQSIPVHNLEFVEADIRDEKAVLKAVEGCSTVFHVAAMISFWAKQKQLQWEINVDGTKNLMNSCLKAGVQKIVHTSTINALGFPANESEIASEKNPFNWKEYSIGYMDSKFAADEVVREMILKNNLPAVIVHPGTIFGGGKLGNPLNASTYLLNIAKGNLLFYPGGGTSCVGLNDVVNGHLLAAEKGKIGEQYIISGENLSYKDLFNKIADLIGAKPPRAKLPVWLGLFIGNLLVFISKINNKSPLITPEVIQVGEIFNFYSSDKAKNELGYSYQPFHQVLSETWQAIKEQKLV